MTDTLISDPTIDCDPNNFDINISSPYLSVKDFNNIRHINHKLSILQLNGRSLITNCDALQILLSTINSKFDIISICETCFNQYNLTLYNIECYISLHTTRIDKHGGDVVLYINSNYKSNKINHLSYSNSFIDYITVEIELSITNIIISSIYRHRSLKKDSYLCLNTFIEFFSQFKNKQIILCGDFNIDLLDDNIHTNNFLNTLQLNNLFQSINNPTRITDKTTKLIDNIFYNGNVSNIYSDIS